MYTDYGYQNQLLCSPCLNTCFMCSCWALSRSLTTNLGVANIKTQVSSSHYMNTSLTAQERCRSCHLGPHLLYRRLCAAMSMSMNHKLWQVVMLVHSFKYPPKKPTLCELVAVDVRPANVQQEILLKIDTNTVKINLNVTFIKEMPTQYHTGCHWQLSRKCKRQN